MTANPNQFPYSLNAVRGVLDSQWDAPEFAEYRAAFPAEHAASPASLEAHFRELVGRDAKVAYVKSLQGYLWRRGYEAGELRAPLFTDVAPRLRAWRARGLRLMIYSSGSVPAQKLLFAHTNADADDASGGPDLTPLIADWFDTVNAGPKTETASYGAIARSHPDVAPDQWLFLSDNVREVDAAIAAGMQSYVVQRPGNAELPPGTRDRLQVIESFDELGEDFGVRK